MNPSQRCSFYLRRASFVLLAGLLPLLSLAQGTIPKAKDGSVKGALVFLPNSKLSAGFHTATSTFFDQKDPMVDPNNWIDQFGNTKVKGLVQDAILLFQWWTFFGDPIEKYGFKWTTSGYYGVQYEDKGQMVTRHIYRSQLAKYPDLLKKFDRIEPLNVDVEITFNTGDIDDQRYYDFRRKYNINSDLGSAGYKGSYTIVSKGIHYLFAPSGEDAPFIVPTMAVGGWPDFLNIPKGDPERIQRNIELFRLGRVLKIHSFRIKSIEWPMSTLVEIAKKYERYENKEDSPKELAEKGAMENQADGGDDFWNQPEVVNMEMEVYRDPTNSKYGLKAKSGLRALPATYDQLEPAAQKGFYLGRTNGRIVALNGMGREIASVTGNEWSLGNGGVSRNVNGPSEDCSDINVIYYESMKFENGKFGSPEKYYMFSRAFYLTATSPGSTITDEDRKRWAKEEKECQNNARARAESAGFKSLSK